jgi:hypothetical protein
MGRTDNNHEWDERALAELHRLLGSGKSKALAAAALGVSRSAVMGKLRRLRQEQASAPARPGADWEALEDAGRAPRPAGHPATWGLITSEGWPGPGPSTRNFSRAKETG